MSSAAGGQEELLAVPQDPCGGDLPEGIIALLEVRFNVSATTLLIGETPMPADDFVNDYWEIDAGSTTISINKYLIGGRFAGAGAAAKVAQQQRIFSLATQKNLKPQTSVFGRARNGKVSPDDCSHILTLAIQTGAVKESELQKWADGNLGVDCTGFAVAYYDDIGI